MNEVNELHWVVYRGVLPLMVVLGIIINTLCLVVLSRPSLRSKRVNWYFLALASSDLLACIFYLPVITTITGCTFSSYSEAFYFTHFGWTLVGVFQSFGTYIIVWLSLDRFIAVWMYEIYPQIQQRPNVKRNRLVVTAIACLTFHLLYMIHAEVRCSDPVEGDAWCTRGHWVSTSGYQYQFDALWHKIYSFIHGLFIRWVPCCLLIFFNGSLVVGVVQGRVNVPVSTQSPGRRRERNLVIITIAITASYILLTFPIMVYITGFAKGRPDRCSGHYPQEVLRAVGNILQLTEHILHIAFLVGLNRCFRRELKIILRLEKPEINGVDNHCVEDDAETSQHKTKSKLDLSNASPNLHSTTPNRTTLTPVLDASNLDAAAM